MYQGARECRVVILMSGLLLALVGAAHADPAPLLSGSDGSGWGDAPLDVVVIRGSRVGGAIPEPQSLERAPAPQPVRQPTIQAIHVLIVPIVSVTTPVGVFPAGLAWRRPQRAVSVWKRHGRPSSPARHHETSAWRPTSHARR